MVKRRFANVELANYRNDPYHWGTVPTFGGRTRISSKDRLLVEKGGTNPDAAEIYLDLLTDPQVFFCWDKQMSEISSKEWYVLPGGERKIDQEAADYVRSVLENLSCMSEDTDEKGMAILSNSQGIDGLTRGLGLALITGISYAEVVWYSDKSYNPSVKKVVVRDPRRFFFENKNNKNYLKMVTKKHYYDGIYVPSRKFIVHRHWGIPTDDIYGCGLGKMVYYPVSWKKELLTLWLTIVDKYSDPTIVGKYDEDTDQELQEEFKEAISSLSREMYISMPGLFSVEMLTPNLTSVDVLEKLEKICDAYISKVILGESTTGESQAGGVLRENVSNSIRVMKAQAFSDLICDTLNNTLIKWITYYKFGNRVAIPKFKRNFEDVEAKIELLNRMNNLGFKATREYVENLTGIPLEQPRSRKRFGV